MELNPMEKMYLLIVVEVLVLGVYGEAGYHTAEHWWAQQSHGIQKENESGSKDLILRCISSDRSFLKTCIVS